MKVTLSFLLLLFCFAASNAQESCKKDINDVLREMAAVSAEQKVAISSLKDRVAALEKREAETDKMKKANQVAFSVSLVSDGQLTLGPFHKHTTLVYKYVVTNVGNAYSPLTGIFTAPVKGAYQFEWYVGVHGHASSAGLFLNEQHVFLAWEQQKDHFGTASNGVTLILEAGDKVTVRLWAGTKIYDNLYHHATFSGRLLFSM